MTKRKPSADSDTKEKIIQTAIGLFAKYGLGSVSLRQITKEAKVNSALMHYYFGTKEDFYDAIFARCLKPINEQRRAKLAAIEKSKSGRLKIADVIRAWAEPVLENEVSHHHPTIMLRLYGDISVQPDTMFRKTTEYYSRETFALFQVAFKRALSHLGEHEATWRFFMMVSIVRNVCLDPHLLRQLTSGRSSIDNIGTFLNELIDNTARAMQAPGVASGYRIGSGSAGRKRRSA
jgi:AcrR family transcriptional regulator